MQKPDHILEWQTVIKYLFNDVILRVYHAQLLFPDDETAIVKSDDFGVCRRIWRNPNIGTFDLFHVDLLDEFPDQKINVHSPRELIQVVGRVYEELSKWRHMNLHTLPESEHNQ